MFKESLHVLHAKLVHRHHFSFIIFEGCLVAKPKHELRFMHELRANIVEKLDQFLDGIVSIANLQSILDKLLVLWVKTIEETKGGLISSVFGIVFFILSAD